MNRLRTLWGEPVLIWAVIQATTTTLWSFHCFDGIGLGSQDAWAVVIVVENALAGVHIAVVTVPRKLLGPITEAFKAAIALLAIYGFQINDKQTALVIGLFAALSAAWHQSQVSPAPVPPPQPAPPVV
jgi:hypothetical protein